jgi:hypothetical protein
MTIGTTPKLGLPTDTLGEGPISTQPSVWDRVDESAGVLTTTKGVDIPVGDLYDGAIVAEKDTGISWRCKTDGAGGFTKQYINYPWMAIGYHYTAGAGNSVNTLWGWGNDGGHVNTSHAEWADPATNFIKVPIKALYSFTTQCRWDVNGVGVRRTTPLWNGAPLTDYEQVDTSFGLANNVGQVTKWVGVLNKGDIFGQQVWQNSGGGLYFYTSVFATLIRPVP